MVIPGAVKDAAKAHRFGLLRLEFRDLLAKRRKLTRNMIANNDAKALA
jgi:hypothetical protein